MSSIEIRRPKPADRGELETLITEHFTEGSSYEVTLGFDDPTFELRVATTDEQILGVMAVNALPDIRAVGEEMYFFDSTEHLPTADRYGLLETSYVRDGFTGQGIGSQLLERIHEPARGLETDVLLADCWYHGGPDSPEKLMDRHGYDTVHREPLEEPFADCPKCAAECTCEQALAVCRKP
jgi:GNAT superfamily N-acetyltransferase